jgi:VanZ family protein
MALLLEILRVPGFDRTSDRLDYVSFSIEMNRRFPFVFFWGPPILYAGLIFWLSSISTLPHIPENSDKFFHFIEYFVFAVLIWRAFGLGKFWFFNSKQALLTTFIASTYAASDEFHQLFVPGRSASIYDWIADVAGILGMLTLMIVKVKWKDGTFKYETT